MRNIKRIRLAKNWTQRYIADELDITEATYGRYESGDLNIKLGHIIKIASLFKMSLDEIVQYDPDNPQAKLKQQDKDLLKDKDNLILLLEKQTSFLERENKMLQDLADTKSKYLKLLEEKIRGGGGGVEKIRRSNHKSKVES